MNPPVFWKSGQPMTPAQIEDRKRKLDAYHDSLTRETRSRFTHFLLAKTRDNAEAARASVIVGNQMMGMLQEVRAAIAGLTDGVEAMRRRQDAMDKRILRIPMKPRMRPPAPAPASR